jgi:hypothetical protein
VSRPGSCRRRVSPHVRLCPGRVGGPGPRRQTVSMRRARIALFALTAGCTRAATPVGPPDVTILYSTDLRGVVASPVDHAGGLARHATLVDRARLSARTVVQVDGGDFAPGVDDEPSLDSAARTARAQQALQAYRRMGVDVITVGERDLALGPPKLRVLCDQAQIAVVAANIVGDDGRALFPPHRIVRAGAAPVGVFGLLELAGDHPAPLAGVTVTDPVAAARAAVSALRVEGARVVVGLFHVAGGLARARAIAGAVTGIDVVVLGHAGPPEAPRFVRTAPQGAQVGRLDIRFGPRPTIQDQVLATTPDVAEQLGVRLLVRLAGPPVPATFDESMALRKKAGLGTFNEEWTYSSTPLCVSCHTAQAAQWRTTAHATAFATLEDSGHGREPGCLGCHMTGFLLPGGAQNLETATTQLTDVGCEACHGPSAEHVRSTDKHRGTSRTVDPVICLGCHTPDQSDSFSPREALKRVIGPGHGMPGGAKH